MAYSLLAHLYPRIKGSQEDVATYSLGYILEQSTKLNQAFSELLARRLDTDLPSALSYNCQDADSEFGRPDIAGYYDGGLKLLCEAKFYAGLTENQPVSYIKRLRKEHGVGIVFICPEKRIKSLWIKLLDVTKAEGISEKTVADYCVEYQGIRMAIVSWSDINAELVRVAEINAQEYLGDVKQLQGFCEKIDSEAFIPFRPEDFSAQVARDIERYYEVIDGVYGYLSSRKDLDPRTAGLRQSPKRDGYSRYIRLKEFGITVSFLRTLWKAPTSIETPFWFCVEEIIDGKWCSSERIKHFYSGVDAAMREDYYGEQYQALVPKAYCDLGEMAEDLGKQIIAVVEKIESQ